MLHKILQQLQSLTGHENIRLTSRGNSAIRKAIGIVRKSNGKSIMLIPDQGGWITYSQFAEKRGFEVVRLKTDFGVIDLQDLQSKACSAAALIYCNPAGYFAHQPIQDIYEVCKGKCIVIMDVTGCIGDDKLCDGRFADIMVASFGEFKPVNLGTGGFISSRDLDLGKGHDIDTGLLPNLDERLATLKRRLDNLYAITQRVKSDLWESDIINRDRTGINVIVRFSNEYDRTKILKYCEDQKLQYTFCPRYIRVMADAVSIEIKRLVE